jgi:glutamate 5-kinase
VATLTPKDGAQILRQAKRVVVKAGSSLLCYSQNGTLRDGWMAALAQDLAELRQSGTQIIMVSSGAVALGRRALGLPGGALALEQKQAAAAVGQPMLASAWQTAFAPQNIITAQALLTLEDTEQRRRWLNSRATLEALLMQDAMPVVNENDTVATDEIRYGDNDRLAARVAQMCGADVLILLSDIDGLWSADPHRHKDARRVPHVAQIDDTIMAMAEGPNPNAGTGSGGMMTKLVAARMATQNGCTVVLASGVEQHPLQALTGGAPATVFAAQRAMIDARKGWIAGTIKPAGQVQIDAGALRALQNGASLLPAGMTACSGEFSRGDVLAICDAMGREIGRGLASYSAKEAHRICGLRSEEISQKLGYSARAAMIHRDHLVLLHKDKGE